MNNCGLFEDSLSAYIDDELNADELIKLNAHLENCEECGSDLSDLRGLVSALRKLPELEPPPDFRERLMKALAEEAPAVRFISERKRRPRRVYANVAAGMALVFIMISALMASFLGAVRKDSAPESVFSGSLASVSQSEVLEDGARLFAEIDDAAEESEYAGGVYGDFTASAETPALAPSAFSAGGYSEAQEYFDAEDAEEYALDGGIARKSDRIADIPENLESPLFVAGSETFTNARISVEVDDLAAAVDAIDSLPAAVTYKNVYSGDYAEIQIAPETPDYDYTLDEVRALGSPVGEYENTRAVALELNDAGVRLYADQLEYDRVFGLLGQAADVGDMLAVEERLSVLNDRIDASNTTINTLKNQENYPRIDIVLLQKTPGIPEIKETLGGRLSKSFSASFDATAGALQNVLVFLSSVVVPTLLVGAIAAAAALTVRIRGKRRRKER